MVEEKPIYIGMYYLGSEVNPEYTFLVGFDLPQVYDGNLVQKLRVTQQYYNILTAHLNGKKLKELGSIEFQNIGPKQMLLYDNYPIDRLKENIFNSAKNTGLGSFLLLLASTHLKKLGGSINYDSSWPVRCRTRSIKKSTTSRRYKISCSNISKRNC